MVTQNSVRTINIPIVTIHFIDPDCHVTSEHNDNDFI